MARTSPRTIEIEGVRVEPGRRERIEIPVARLPTQTMLTLPFEVVNGSRHGPQLWLSAAIHGDELNGMEIIQRVLQQVSADRLRGTLLAVPIVNVFGFIHQSRYLPDRRDLNRCFPGSAKGSLASRLAKIFMTAIVNGSDFGIDLHTGSNNRTNLPQVRGNLKDEATLRMARAFDAPIMIDGNSPAGSLRSAVAKKGIPTIVYEAGEPLRFDEDAIAIGVRGIRRVMAEIGMVRRSSSRVRHRCLLASRRTWIRARRSGVLRLAVGPGDTVEKGQLIATVRDIFGDRRFEHRSPADGLVIGSTKHPLVNQGDAMVHLAREVSQVDPAAS